MNEPKFAIRWSVSNSPELTMVLWSMFLSWHVPISISLGLMYECRKSFRRYACVNLRLLEISLCCPAVHKDAFSTVHWEFLLAFRQGFLKKFRFFFFFKSFKTLLLFLLFIFYLLTEYIQDKNEAKRRKRICVHERVNRCVSPSAGSLSYVSWPPGLGEAEDRKEEAKLVPEDRKKVSLHS